MLNRTEHNARTPYFFTPLLTFYISGTTVKVLKEWHVQSLCESLWLFKKIQYNCLKITTNGVLWSQKSLCHLPFSLYLNVWNVLFWDGDQPLTWQMFRKEKVRVLEMSKVLQNQDRKEPFISWLLLTLISVAIFIRDSNFSNLSHENSYVCSSLTKHVKLTHENGVEKAEPKATATTRHSSWAASVVAQKHHVQTTKIVWQNFVWENIYCWTYFLYLIKTLTNTDLSLCVWLNSSVVRNSNV